MLKILVKNLVGKIRVGAQYEETMCKGLEEGKLLMYSLFCSISRLED